MGSIVVSDVVNHFSPASGYNMFGANHRTSQEPQTSSHYHHQAQHQHTSHLQSAPSSRPQNHVEHPNNHNRAVHQSPADTQMTDAPTRPVSTGGPPSAESRGEHAAFVSTSMQDTSSAAHQQAVPSVRPPPSPRYHGNLPNAQGHTPNAANNPNFSYASSIATSGSSAHQSPAYNPHSSVPTAPSSPSRIKVRSLSHIQSFANDSQSPLSRSRSVGSRPRKDDIGPQYEISEMPVADVIEMVAGLLTKITTTNDRQHEHIQRQIPPPEGTSGLSQQTNSVLAFHGKNVPQISILSYLSRIHKYCPTTYEVFLSLLVYFDRMTERVNSGPMQALRKPPGQSEMSPPSSSPEAGPETRTTQEMDVDVQHSVAPTPPPSGSLGKPAEAKDATGTTAKVESDESHTDEYNLSHYFVVDSYNIHRLVIAGVTCASKFFSDIFYTNSRYAKVGGLPLPELNHLEVQFLLLNDFRLSIPLEEIQAYGTMLVEFYAREVLAQQ